MRQYSFSLSLFRTHNGGHANPRFTFPVVCSLKSSPLSLVHPIRCVVECKCGKCFLSNSEEEGEEFFAKWVDCQKGEKIAKINPTKKRKKLPKRRFISFFTTNIPSKHNPHKYKSNKAARRRRRRRRTRERERTKENLCDGYAAILLRILRRVPHARFPDRSKTTHFRI
jgi:hypothetical protein